MEKGVREVSIVNLRIYLVDILLFLSKIKMMLEIEDIDTLNHFIQTPLLENINEANRLRKEHIGEKIELCSIINAKSGLCPEDCKFCAQSLHSMSRIPTYPLKEEEDIYKSALRAKEIGAEKFGIVTSGNRLKLKEIKKIATVIEKIQSKIDIKVCCSLGALNKQELKLLKSVGLTRYHHNIETSPEFYPEIVSTHTFSERIETINCAKEVGLEVCSGGIIGLGESWLDRWKMAKILKELDVDSVPINIFVPIEGTPLQHRQPISASEAIKTICLFRIILKDKIIKVAAGRETALKDFHGFIYIAGANGMLIGGYLTIRGREIKEDHQLIEEIKRMWRGEN
jgi:biotin synthase